MIIHIFLNNTKILLKLTVSIQSKNEKDETQKKKKKYLVNINTNITHKMFHQSIVWR